jgi:hypothetical protein
MGRPPCGELKRDMQQSIEVQPHRIPGVNNSVASAAGSHLRASALWTSHSLAATLRSMPAASDACRHMNSQKHPCALSSKRSRCVRFDAVIGSRLRMPTRQHATRGDGVIEGDVVLPTRVAALHSIAERDMAADVSASPSLTCKEVADGSQRQRQGIQLCPVQYESTLVLGTSARGVT